MDNRFKPYMSQTVRCEIDTGNKNTTHISMVNRFIDAGGNLRTLKGSDGKYTCELTRSQVAQLGLLSSQVKVLD